MKLRHIAWALLGTALLHVTVSPAADAEPQPFFAALRQLMEATDYLGSPFSDTEKINLARCIELNSTEAVDAACEVLDKRSLFQVSISPEMRVKVEQGDANPELHEGGWTQFIIRVDNEAGATSALKVFSTEAGPVFEKAGQRGAPPTRLGGAPLNARWLDMQMWNMQPLKPTLSGLGIEYRLIGLYSRDPGQRQARIAFDIGQGTQDLGFRNEVSILFNCKPAREIKLHITDENDVPCIASLLIKDSAGRVYPSQIKRLAPDFGFQPQIYRADGETLKLPDGAYDITFERGPESIKAPLHVNITGDRELRYRVKRWTDPSNLGWWSGDHHIHAAGCAHYTLPSEGVHAPDMARHCQGEDLKIGANLTWGPCFDYQKQFFTGKEDKVSQYPFLLRYDIEVSGFGSHKSGHLCLLKLKDQMYPGGDSTAHWPTLCLNTLKWAKKQGALCGPAHSGWGLQPLAEKDPARTQPYKGSGLRSATDELPNNIIPPFNGIGANEYIVDVTHEVEGPEGRKVPAVDFMSLADTPHTWELNIWYHTLNAGFRTRASGETDFPCIYGERVGLGRSYVKLDGKLSYNDWCEGIRAGRCYVSDGRSHLMNFKVNETALGENGSELNLAAPGTVKITATVAALLNETPDAEIQHAPADKKPYWHLERARIGSTRDVPVEVIVNGQSVANKIIAADGSTSDVNFEVPINTSSWIALRIRASSHTNPVFVIVDKRPIRVKRSLEWCLKSVDQCWSQKEALIDPKERTDAVAAYDHARKIYQDRLTECRPESAQAGFETRMIAGWRVLISEELKQQQPEATAKALSLLDAQLKGIINVVPSPAVLALQRVKLWMTPPKEGERQGAEYHPDAGWLKAHGRDVAMAKCVQFSNIPNFEKETVRMPQFALHELSHAYHDQVLGFDNPDIIAAYEHAKAAGLYDKVERWFGNGRPNTFERAYAMTNHKEYFAECSEAFFGRNDFFPFTREELEKHDPQIFAVLRRVWQE